MSSTPSTSGNWK